MGPKKRQQEFDDEDNSEASGTPNTQPGIKKVRRAVKGPHAQSDFKLDLILKKLASIETQNSEIVNKVKDIEFRVVATERNLESVRTDCDTLSCTVEKLQTDLQGIGHVPSSSLSALEVSVASLTSIHSARRSESEYLYSEVNKLNLLIAGIIESPQESSSSLAQEVQRLILDITGKKITVDVAHRIGRNQPDRVRTIKVRFLSVLERNCVYFHRKNLSHPYYINEDLSAATREDHSLLRRMKRDILLKDKAANIKIDWRLKTLQHGSSSYAVKDGILVPSTPRLSTSNISGSQRTTSFLEDPTPSTSRQRRNIESPPNF
jgi:hypothetical protein